MSDTATRMAACPRSGLFGYFEGDSRVCTECEMTGKSLLAQADDALAAWDVGQPVEDGGPDDGALVDPAGQKPKRIIWIWRKWLALGLQAILDGDPGLGKSLIVLDLIARASRGDPMPDGQRPPTLGDAVFIISTEEDLYYETILPRLHAAGTDFSGKHAAVYVFTGKLNASTKEREMLTLPEDTEYLRRLIRQAKLNTAKRYAVFYADPFVAHTR
jgi:AAA domain